MNDASKRSDETLATHVRVVRLGHGANCSSLGSVVDTLFATAVVGGALYVAVSAALAREPVTREIAAAPPEDQDESEDDDSSNEKAAP